MGALDEINALGCWEWQLASFNGVELMLIGGGNLVYGHHAEMRCQNVHYLDCPVRLMHPRFRPATAAEITVLARKVNIDSQSVGIAIEAETTASTDIQTFFIVAEGLAWQSSR